MREVVVLGVGMTPFGKFRARSLRELGADACWDALADAGMKPSEVQVAYCGNLAGGLLSGQEAGLGQIILREVGIAGIPVTKVENACSSGSVAFREAWIAVGSGLYDVAFAIGVEKLTEGTTAEVTTALASAGDMEMEAALGLVFPGIYAMLARRRMAVYGESIEQCARVAIKNHRHGALNPRAQYRNEITLEEIAASPMISDPLTLLHCCPIGDGAAAAILCSTDVARRGSRPAIRVAASALTSGLFREDREYVGFESTQRAAAQAYEQAGVGPEEIDLAEVHDCFSVAELCHYEDLGFCAPGEGGRLIDSGATALGGRIPVNPSGGLLAKGHPVGATGLAQIAEVVWQLRGEAEGRQVAGARLGLTHCQGGNVQGDALATTIHILQR